MPFVSSRLAMEALKSNRLGPCTEKSTCYQRWAPDAFHVPAELEEGPLREEYLATCRLLFETYAASVRPVRRVVESASPRRENETEEGWDRRVRSQNVDVCRGSAPVGPWSHGSVNDHNKTEAVT